MFSETMSLVVPALLLTIALSLPQILLKSDDFPTFGSPIIVITSPFLTLIPILVCSISFSKLSFASSSMDKSVFGCLVSSRSWSEKSNMVSTKTLTSVTLFDISPTFFENSPAKDLLAAIAVLAEVLSIKSATASACVKSILSLRYARFVNSPGCASLPPNSYILFRIISTIAGLPWELNSATSSPV